MRGASKEQDPLARSRRGGPVRIFTVGTPKTSAMIPAASRMASVSYAIRRVVAEARKAEATGTRIHYLNTGDPVAFGFATPAHMVEAVRKALTDGENGYGPSIG